ncbi:hypothetical protein [Larsenimonas rhizosphaerae]|uniref:Uncharacterized protein n=1 Tax=Larsenimonas rhizosphaerae TaxID=2944682 RepID=A0AA41ZFL5_9GAMM|nr:hypothetical protein [Larsenimonas rhizosphaerae]MCX2523741.1 hypothetical protein [Larsenimonas rhizosphaerae]
MTSGPTDRNVGSWHRPGSRWLAGLLFGCLLPLGLAQARTDNVEARHQLQLCFCSSLVLHTLADLRAHQMRVNSVCRPVQAPRFTALFPSFLTLLTSVWSVAHDMSVMSRRGPPRTPVSLPTYISLL